MSEMDIFVELINDQEADRILKFYGETLVGTRNKKASLTQKKQYIKRIFKSNTPNMIKKRMKGSREPFYNYIQSYKSSELVKENNFLETVIFLNEVNSEIPNHVKFVILFLNFPEETKQKFDIIQENIKERKYPFNFNESFEDSTELKAFFRKSRSFIGEKAPRNIVDNVLEILTEQEKDLLKKCEDELENYDILSYYNNIEYFKEKYNLIFSNAAYILTHDKEDNDILMLLAVELLYDLLKLKHQIKEKLFKEEDEKFKEELLNIKIDKKKKEKENERKISLLLTDFSKERRILTSTINEKDRHLKQLAISEENLKRERNKLEQTLISQKEEEKTKREETERIIDKLSKELESVNEVRKENKIMMTNNSSKVKHNWGIICAINYELTKEIYPELDIIYYKNKREVKEILVNNQLSTIYLLINGLPTAELNNIKEKITSSEKEYKVIDFNNFKEFLDWIGYMKTIERKVYSNG
ncbi:hypothetical protein [Sporosarcina cascadiensis]|uniref:hypothetical protein n=1 Tax=Sporosarcina cascadiensis TaxID=2660747 RepID=UPI00129B9B97|nr:hypothetical protein [Sporosarcina cascadiensis]